MAIGDLKIESYVPIVKLNEGLYTGLPIETTSNLIVAGNLTVGGDLTLTGDITLDDATINDDLGVTGDLTVTGDISFTGAVEAAEHGAGAIGTAVAPKTRRWNEGGVIVTRIEVDLTGLDSSGTENDVIGLSTGGAAYIGRNVVATNGLIFKVEMSCIEVPLTGDADVILVQGSAADEAFDDTVANTAVLADGTGDWAIETITTNAPALTANYYYYLTQGATDDATYTAGQFIITTYGHALLA